MSRRSLDGQTSEPELQPRPMRRVFVLAGLLLCLTVIGQLWTDLAGALGALPIQIRLRGLGEQSVYRASVARLTPLGKRQELAAFFLSEGDVVWQLARGWARALVVELPESSLTDLKEVWVRIGPREYTFSREEFLAKWRRLSGGHHPLGERVARFETPPVAGPGRPPILNWPEGMPRLLAGRMTWPLAVVALFLGLAALVTALWRQPTLRRWLSVILGLEQEQPREEQTACVAIWFLAGLLVLGAVLVRLHLADRYWFTQDDNRVQFLPNLIYACRAVFRGEVPSWSPHEHLGNPLMEPGHYPLTYPPTYLCYALARWLGDECQTMQFWAWTHLLVGYAGTFLFGRTIGLRPALAAAASLSFVLSGFFLILGRAWTAPVTVAAWLPLFMLPFAQLQRGASPARLALGLGLIAGAGFHTSNTQFWVYAMMYVAAAPAVLALSGSIRLQRIYWVLPGILFAVALAAPLLVPQAIWAARLHRTADIDYGILSYLPRLILPSPVVDWIHEDGWSGVPGRGHYFYCGTVLPAAGLAGVALLAGALLGLAAGGGNTRAAESSIAAGQPNLEAGAYSPRPRPLCGLARSRRLLASNLWSGLAAVAFVLALGVDGFVWLPLSALPGLSFFNHPIKLLPYLTFFLAAGGATIFERLLRASKAARAWERGLFAAVAILMAYHASPSLPAFTRWPIPLPYPPLPGLTEPALLTPERRILPLTETWNGDRLNLWSLSFSLPAWYGLHSAGGYNPLVNSSPESLRVARRFIADPVGSARAYGVRWCLQRRTYQPPAVLRDLSDAGDMTTSKFDSPQLLPQVSRAGSLVHRGEAVQVWELPSPAPLAFAGSRELPVAFRGDGAIADTASLPGGGTVVINVLWRPAMRAYADGRPVELAPDAWDRIEVHVPAGTRSLQLRYEPDWRLGLVTGCLLAALGLLALKLAPKEKTGGR